MKNAEVREYAKSKGVKHWQIAEELGITEFTFSRQLRHELSEDRKKAIFSAIDRASKVIAV